jgi:hypothetical protein
VTAESFLGGSYEGGYAPYYDADAFSGKELCLIGVLAEGVSGDFIDFRKGNHICV